MYAYARVHIWWLRPSTVTAARLKPCNATVASWFTYNVFLPRILFEKAAFELGLHNPLSFERWCCATIKDYNNLKGKLVIKIKNKNRWVNEKLTGKSAIERNLNFPLPPKLIQANPSWILIEPFPEIFHILDVTQVSDLLILQRRTVVREHEQVWF